MYVFNLLVAKCAVYWVDVDGSGSSKDFRFLAFACLSEPPKYFLSVRHDENCLGLTRYVSCICFWVVLAPNLFKILNAYVSARSLVSLFTFSLHRRGACGSGFSINFTRSCCSSGSSSGFLGVVAF